MARRKRRSRRRQFTLPIAPIAGLAAGMASPVTQVMAGNWAGALRELQRNYTGIEPSTGKFNIDLLMKGTVPLVAGLLVHKFIGGAPLNLNRTLASAGVPFIRI